MSTRLAYVTGRISAGLKAVSPVTLASLETYLYNMIIDLTPWREFRSAADTRTVQGDHLRAY